MKFNTIRFKASIFYSVILAVILSIFGSVIYFNLDRILIEDLDIELEMKAKEIVSILKAYEKLSAKQDPTSELLLQILERQGIIQNEKMIVDELWRSKLEVLRLTDDYINILNISGSTIVYSNNTDRVVFKLFKEQLPVSFKEKYFKTIKKGKQKLRAINMPVDYLSAHLVLQIATPLKRTVGILKQMSFLLIVFILFILFLTCFMGGLFAERALIPVKNAINVANHIVKHKDLSVRVEEKQSDEEMKTLVKSFNNMISKIETSFKHISEFSSHVAHELKTPLAITKGEIELALDQERDKDEYKRVLEACLQEIDRMIRVIKDLLLLAKLDYKPEIFKFENINLNAFLKEIHEHILILASEKNIEANLDLPEENISINADKVHFRRLVLNLINNAICYTPDNGKVTITLKKYHQNVSIDITDSGIGIDKENMDKIFAKFFRVKKDTSEQDLGTGLGLNIALSIAHAHNGELTVKSQLNEGSTFTITLPIV